MGVEVHPMDTNQQQADRQAAQDLKRLQKKLRSLDNQIAKVEEEVRTLTASTSTDEKSSMFSSSRTLPYQRVFICPPPTAAV
jgi:peptidoglycan hydrolase CwlO-like protein